MAHLMLLQRQEGAFVDEFSEQLLAAALHADEDLQDLGQMGEAGTGHPFRMW